MYTGKSGGNAERGLAHRVVTDLVAQLHDKGTVLYIDNFFTSIPLLQELKELLISVVGTIRNNRKGYPKALQDKNLLKWHLKQQFAQCVKTRNMFLFCQMCTLPMAIAQSLEN